MSISGKYSYILSATNIFNHHIENIEIETYGDYLLLKQEVKKFKDIYNHVEMEMKKYFQREHDLNIKLVN